MKKLLIFLAIAVGGITVFLIIVSFVKDPSSFESTKNSSLVLTKQSQAQKTQTQSTETSATETSNYGPASALDSSEENSESSESQSAETSSQDPSTRTIPHLIIEIPVDSDLVQELPLHFEEVANDLYQVKAIDPEGGAAINLVKHLKTSQVYFPADLLGAIDTLSFFVYRGPSDLGPSEAIFITNQESAQTNADIMASWEPNLIEDLRTFVLIGEKYDLIKASGKNQFATSTQFSNTRYVNFSQDNAVSLSYTVGEGFILISNSYSAHQTMVGLLTNE